MKIKDRIRQFDRVYAKDLIPNPRNWRIHSTAQADALKGILAEIGWSDCLLVRETIQGLELLDGHLRASLNPDQLVPVLVLDLNEQEADLLLASLDPIAAMAGADANKLQDLLGNLETNNEALQNLFDDLAEQNGIFDVQEATFPDLPAGDRTTPHTMNFTLTAEQAETVKAALKKAKAQPFTDTGNENSNGNALARIAEAYVEG